MFTDRQDSVFNIKILSFIWVSLKSIVFILGRNQGDYVIKLNAPTSPAD
jgi:hypothetical protein